MTAPSSNADSAPTPRIAARMRFEDPAKFLEFHQKQLSKQAVGLRHPEPIPEGTPFQVIVSPPGAPDRLRLEGRATKVTARPDGTVRVRVQVELSEVDREWLEAYLTGLRAALPPMPLLPDTDESTEVPLMRAPDPVGSDEARVIIERMDDMTYYELLGAAYDSRPELLQQRFHELTRRFHPDLFYTIADGELRERVHRIYRRVNEAYGVLRDPRRRRLYDRGLQGPPHTWRLRLSEEDEQTAQRQARTRRGSTRPGHYYWTMARDVLERARQLDQGIRPALRESARLLRTAMVFEPDNEHFRHALEHVTDRLNMPEDD